jgi:hypothetical protein
MAKFGKEGAAVLIMAAIIAVLLMLCTPRSTSKSSAVGATTALLDSIPARVDPREVRVLVLSFDPIVPAKGVPAHQAFGLNDPHRLAQDYAGTVMNASGGRMRYHIVDWRDIREIPRKRDGFQYTAESYATCLTSHGACHDPDGADYGALLEQHGVPALINSRAIDEVWLFGGPFFGFYEAAMAGPGSFDINGEAFPDVKTNRAFAIMGFSYERGVAEMLHNLCHRIEGTMSQVYGGWSAESLTTSWARFAANARQSGGRAGVGSCHYPPNATKEYDYENEQPVESDADDWTSYPNLTGRRGPVAAYSWGGSDYHRSYMVWWLEHLPRADTTAPDGKLANWWSYAVHFDSLVIARAP